jgi:glycosyltransferase involved in cell wall biosynthesis
MVAGWRTQYANTRAVAAAASDLSMHYVEVNPYKEGGMIERLPFLGRRTKGSIRAFLTTFPLFRVRPIHGIWTHANTAVFPFLATRAHLQRIPYVIAADATLSQIEAFKEYRLTQPNGGRSLKHRLRDAIEGYLFRHAAYVIPCSEWAAGAITSEFGVPRERIVVVPPGIDLTQWQPRPSRSGSQLRAPTKLLFVGGDFERKGGHLLLDVYRRYLRGRCELHLVTKEPVQQESDVVVYPDLGPNDPRLHQLYQTCDIFVLPTQADCSSLASMEAMASGLPVITCSVGGIPEIVDHGVSGWLVPVGDGASLLAAIETLLADPELGRVMGRRGRAIVEERFDVERNTVHVLDLLRELAMRRLAGSK